MWSSQPSHRPNNRQVSPPVLTIMAVCLPLIGCQQPGSRLIGDKSQLVKHIRQGKDYLVSLSGGKNFRLNLLGSTSKKRNDTCGCLIWTFYDEFV